MTVEEVVFSLWDHAGVFVRQYKNCKLKQEVIDAIVCWYINNFAQNECGVIDCIYPECLRAGIKWSKEGTVLSKENIYPKLKFRKEECNRLEIIKTINYKGYMNECDGKAKAKGSEALEVIDEFIKSYMSA